jgi:ribosomal protein S18 acetylase RimI-like enzyme
MRRSAAAPASRQGLHVVKEQFRYDSLLASSRRQVMHGAMDDDAGTKVGAMAPVSVPSIRAVLTARNGGRLLVRRVTPADIPALQRFNAALSTSTRDFFLPHAYDETTLVAIVERNGSGRDRAYVLTHAGEVVGYFFLWEFDCAVPVLGIGLADAWQGQGLAEPMIRVLVGDAGATSRDAIELTTVPENTRAIRLYRRVGFEDVGEVDNLAGDGRIVRERRMFLGLKPGAVPHTRMFKPPC